MRDDIHEHKKLNVHLYNCLKKALYKPAAFFKGFLFPLVQVCSPLQSLADKLTAETARAAHAR